MSDLDGLRTREPKSPKGGFYRVAIAVVVLLFVPASVILGLKIASSKNSNYAANETSSSTSNTTVTSGTSATSSTTTSTTISALVTDDVNPSSETTKGNSATSSSPSSSVGSTGLTGAVASSFVLQGNTASVISASSSNGSTAISFTDPIANTILNVPALREGTYTICTSSGNCDDPTTVKSSTGGTSDKLAKFSSANEIVNSIISDSGTDVSIAGGALIQGSASVQGTLGAQALRIGKTTLLSQATSDLNFNLPEQDGLAGTCLSTDGSGNLTFNACGGGMASFNTTNLSVSAGVLNTIQDIAVTSSPTFNGITSSSLTVNDGGSGFHSSISATTLTANRTITLPNESGTICLQSSTNCGFAASSGSGNYIQNGTTSQTANFSIQSAAAGSVGAVIQGASSQTADLLQLKDSAGVSLFGVSAQGGVSITNNSTLANGKIFGPSSTPGTGMYFGSDYQVFQTAGTPKFFFQSMNQRGFVLANDIALSWVGTSSAISAAPDVFLSRSSANTIRLSSNQGVGAGNLIVNGKLGVASTGLDNLLNVNAATTVDPLAQAVVATGSSTNKGIVLQGVASQTADLFQLQDSAGVTNAAFNGTGNQLTLGRVAASGTVSQGKLVLSDGTTDNYSTTLQSTTLTANQTITLPNESGTICLQSSTNCGFAASSGSANYIQVGLAAAQTDSSNNSMIFSNKTSYTGNLLQLQHMGYDKFTVAQGSGNTAINAPVSTSIQLRVGTSGGNQLNDANLTRGVSVVTTNIGAGDIEGVYSKPVAGSLNIGSLYSFRAALQAKSSPNIYSFYADTPTVVTSAVNAYGLYIQGMNVAGVTNSYGVYSAGANDKNYFAGNVGVAGSASNKLTLNNATTADPIAQALFSTGSASNKGIVIQASPSQTANLIEVQASNGNVIAKVDASGNLQVLNATVNGNLTTNGHVITGGSSPSISAEVASCTSPTLRISGNDTSGLITITTGTGCTTGGKLATVTFATAYDSAPRVTLNAANSSASTLRQYIDSSTITASAFELHTPAAETISDSTTYKWYYHVEQ